MDDPLTPGGDADQGPPPSLICPITQELLEDPVIAADGFTYERKPSSGGSAWGRTDGRPRRTRRWRTARSCRTGRSRRSCTRIAGDWDGPSLS